MPRLELAPSLELRLGSASPWQALASLRERPLGRAPELGRAPQLWRLPAIS